MNSLATHRVWHASNHPAQMSTSTSTAASLPWLQRRSAGTQLALLLALIVVVLVLSLTTLITSLMRSQIERDKGAALAALGRSVTTALAKNFRDRMQQVELLVESSEIWEDGLSGSKVNQALARMKRSRPFPSWIGVANTQGQVVAATDGLLVGRDVGQRPWFPAGLKGRYVGDVHEAKLLAGLLAPAPNGEPIRFVDFAAPLTIKDRIVGVLGLHADVKGVRTVAEAFIPKNAEARRIEVYILTGAGEVIFGGDRSAKVELPALLAQLLDAQTNVSPAQQARPAVDFTWGDGERYLTTAWSLDEYAPELKLGWQVLVRQPVDVAYAPARQATTRALSVGMICAVIAFGVGLLLGRQVTKPLRRMALAARDVEKGVPGALIPVADQNQELAQLSSALQSMTGRLEQMVEERTAQLAAANHELRVLGEEQSAMLDNELVGIVRLHMTSRVASWNNRAIAKMFGYSMEELHQQPARMLYADDATYERVGSEAKAAFAAGHDYITRVQMQRKDGTALWIHLQGSPLRERPGESQWMMTDVTAQHLYQEQVEHIAFHDALTGLPNRLLLADRVQQAVAAAQRAGRLCAIAFIDLDGFKSVNDLHGHDAGDFLLKEIAKRAVETLRAGDTVARLGGDEFVAVLGLLETKDQCDAILDRLLQRIQQPIAIPGEGTVVVSASIGVALTTLQGDKPAALLSSADAAMYAAKHAGKGCIRYESRA